MPENNMAARLVVREIANLAQYLTQLFSRHYRQLAQIVTSTISSSIDGGIGSLCFFRLSKYPLIAS